MTFYELHLLSACFFEDVRRNMLCVVIDTFDINIWLHIVGYRTS